VCHHGELTLVPARSHCSRFCLLSLCHRLGKGKYEDGDSINLNDIEKVLPAWQVGADVCRNHPRSHEAQILEKELLKAPGSKCCSEATMC